MIHKAQTRDENAPYPEKFKNHLLGQACVAQACLVNMDLNLKMKFMIKTNLLLSLLFFLLFCIGSIGLNAQKNTLDSLKNELQARQQRDTVTVDLLNQIASKAYRQDIGKTIQYAEEAKALSDSLNYPDGKAKYIYLLGIIQALRSDFDQAISVFKQAYAAYQTIDGANKKDKIMCLQGIAAASYDMNDYQQAIQYAKQAIAGYESISENSGVAYMRNTLGITYREIGAYDSCLIEHRKALSIFEQEGNEKGISHCLNNMGIVYEDHGDYPRALENYMKSLAIDEKLGNNRDIAIALNNIGSIHNDLEEYHKALTFYSKALTFWEEQGDRKEGAGAKINIGRSYYKMNRYDSATHYFRQALEESKQIGDVRLQAGSYINRASMEFSRENY